MDLVKDVALLGGPSWRDNRTHWRDVESYDLAVGPRTGGRLFPKTDERPDKPRKPGQIDKCACAQSVFGEENHDFDADYIEDTVPRKVSPKVEPDDLKAIYGKNCYLAVYADGKKRSIRQALLARVDEGDECEWHDFVFTHIGTRKAVALKGVSVQERKVQKRRPNYGWRKKTRTQDKRHCDIFV
jgi:hypothetical protein